MVIKINYLFEESSVKLWSFASSTAEEMLMRLLNLRNFSILWKIEFLVTKLIDKALKVVDFWKGICYFSKLSGKSYDLKSKLWCGSAMKSKWFNGGTADGWRGRGKEKRSYMYINTCISTDWVNERKKMELINYFSTQILKRGSG